MKLVKDPEGYFVLDNADQKVILSFKGKLVQKLPTIFHIGLCHWHSNEKGSIVNTPFITLKDDISSFKAMRYAIFEYAIADYEDTKIVWEHHHHEP